MAPLILAASLAVCLFAGEAPSGGYPELFERSVAQSARAYFEGQPLPLVPGPRNPAEAQMYGRQFANYQVLAAQAGLVQAGRRTDQGLDAYAAMIRQVADKFAVDQDACVAVYKDRARPAMTVDPAETALEAGLLEEVLANPRIPVSSHKDIGARMRKLRGGLESGLLDDGSAPDAALVDAVIKAHQTQGDPKDLKNIPPRVPVVPLRITPVPSETAGAGSASGGIWAYLDNSAAMKLARDIKAKAVGFKKRCYGYVARALQRVGIIDSDEWGGIDRASAYQFASSLNRNPKLFDKLKLRRVPGPQIKAAELPVGAIIVYDRARKGEARGACGFHPIHGHIEVTVAPTPKPVTACSDGCAPIREARQKCIDREALTGRVNVYIPVTASPRAG